MLHSFTKSALFRQWLLRPDGSPFMMQCRTLLDNAYDFDKEEDRDDEVEPESESVQANAADEVDVSRIAASRGYYTTPNALGKGNSFICFRPKGNPGTAWVPAQIHKIIEGGSSPRFAVRRSLPLDLPYIDPFQQFWPQGFEAKMVSSSWDHLEFIENSWIIGHTARWEIVPGMVVVLNLGQPAGED